MVLIILPNVKNFKSLIYTGNSLIGAKSLLFSLNYQGFLICPSLCRCTGIGDDGLAALAYGCKKIRKLNLCYCTRISDQGMKYVSCLPELKDLELRGLTQVTSLGIVAIAFGCKNLTELDLKRCSAVDDLGFLGLARYAINLRQVHWVSYLNLLA